MTTEYAIERAAGQMAQVGKHSKSEYSRIIRGYLALGFPLRDIKDGLLLSTCIPRLKVHKLEVKRNEPCPCGSGVKFKKCDCITPPGVKR